MGMLKSPIFPQRIDTIQFLLMNINWIHSVCIKILAINLSGYTGIGLCSFARISDVIIEFRAKEETLMIDPDEPLNP